MSALDSAPASVIAVSASKGGTGKSSLVTNLATLFALPGRRVLVIDMDTETGLGLDFGYYNDLERDDQGAGLRHALSTLTIPEVLPAVRPGLDIIPGGRHLEGLPELVSAWESMGIAPNEALALVVNALRPSYDFILIDSAPGESLGRELAFAAADYVLVPTRSDTASIAGVASVARSFQAVATVNPDLRLLGVVLFGINASATSIVADLRAELDGYLGEGACFQTWLRYQERTANASRARGISVAEYERDILNKAPRVGESDWKSRRKGLATSAGSLAHDYAKLAVEILSRLRSYDADKLVRRMSAS